MSCAVLLSDWYRDGFGEALWEQVVLQDGAIRVVLPVLWRVARRYVASLAELSAERSPYS